MPSGADSGADEKNDLAFLGYTWVSCLSWVVPSLFGAIVG